MADNKKYYYLKLKEDFYDRDEIKIIESMPNGYKYSNILLKMYLKALKREGKLMVTDFIPYSVNTLAKVLGHDVDTVRAAIQLFEDFKLIEILDNGAIYLMEIQNFIGKSSTEADRKRLARQRVEDEKKKLAEGQMSDKCPKKIKESHNQAIEISEMGQMSDKYPPETELETELEQQQETDIKNHIEKMLKITPQEAAVIINTCKKYRKKEDIVVVVKEKWGIVTRGNFNNPIGALVQAIKEDWKQSVFNNKNNLRFNDFEQRDYDYDALESKLLGWE